MRTLLIFISLLEATASFAQTGSCSITSSDSSRFLLSVNGVSWGDSAQHSWTFTGEPGMYALTMLPLDSTATLLRSEAEVTGGIARDYQLIFGEDLQHFFLAVVAETSFSPTGDFTVPAVAAGMERALANASVSAGPFQQTLNELRQTVFQRDRKALIEHYVLDHSLSVSQLSEFLSSIDAEDQRLDIAVNALPKLSDVENLEELEGLFYLNHSRERIRKEAAKLAH